jgi:hypothetical protein
LEDRIKADKAGGCKVLNIYKIGSGWKMRRAV